MFSCSLQGSEPMVLEPHDPGQRLPVPLEALVHGAGNQFPPVIYIPPDADDETMVELAIYVCDYLGTSVSVLGICVWLPRYVCVQF